MKVLKMVALFLVCRLAWIWLDQCGSDLGLGEALPFCLDCSGSATAMRLTILLLGGYVVFNTLQRMPEVIPFPEDDPIPGQTYVIHWDRIALLAIVLFYPVLIWWFDRNTTIPGPETSALTRSICEYAGVKGTLIWAIVVTFIVTSFRFLYRT